MSTASGSSPFPDSLAQASPNGTAVYEIVRNESGVVLDFRLINLNKQAALNFAKPTADLQNQLVSTLFPPNDASYLIRQFALVIDNERAVRFEMPSGFGTAQSPQPSGVLVTRTNANCVVVSSDILITDQQQSKLAETFTGVLKAMRNGMSVLEIVRDQAGNLADFRYQYISDQVLLDTGLSRGQLIGHQMLDLFPAVRQTRFWTAYHELLATGETQEFEVTYTGEGYNNHMLCQAILLDDNRIISSYQIINDLKQAELEKEQHNQVLQRANRDLQISNKNLQQFAYVASHDLQEPLRKIQAFGDLLNDRFGPALGPEGSNMLSRMQMAAKRMSLLIRDLLTYSKVSTQQEPYRTVSLNRVVSEVIDVLYVAIQESGAEITVAPLPNLLGDSGQLGQLFQNLLSNAIKFHRPNTVPTIRVTSQMLVMGQIPADLIPKLNSSESFTEITISDNGIGFDGRYSERIFQVFQRLHGRTQYAGSGIGLSICRRVAENHGGTILAISEKGQGATFRVYLPM